VTQRSPLETELAARRAIIEKLEDPHTPLLLTYVERVALAEAARKVWFPPDKATERQRKLNALEFVLERTRQVPMRPAERAFSYKLLAKAYGFKTVPGLHQFMKRERKERRRTKTR
jgi:hypothetical protein